MREILAVAVMLVAFAVLVTTHVAIVWGLAGRSPRWRALAAIFLPPLAPWWAFREGLRARGTIWVVAATLYAAARWLG